jgi:hypothetical protein
MEADMIINDDISEGRRGPRAREGVGGYVAVGEMKEGGWRSSADAKN